MEIKKEEIEEHFERFHSDRGDYFEKMSIGYVFNLEKQYYGVAIDNPNSCEICEDFTNMSIKNQEIEGKNLLILASRDYYPEYRNAFVTICKNFIDNHSDIAKDPKAWYEEWARNMGNAYKKISEHDVVGELLSILYLQKNGKKEISWAAANEVSGSVDIQADDKNYEVKSTLNKSTKNISTSVSQMRICDYIIHCRLEEDKNGINIDNLLKITEREDEYPSRSRGGKTSKKYRILEMKIYEKDDMPKLPDFVTPNGISSISYSVNLDVATNPKDITNEMNESIKQCIAKS